jgi:catechol 2,3-dioxygenase-like lactoylglutathione lyase family enzyme
MERLVEGLTWLGTRTERYEELVAFFRDVMGLEVDHEAGGMTAFSLPDGSTVEVFGPQDEDHDHFDTGPVGGFLVGDIEEARARLEAGGATFIGDTERDGGMAWAHFRAPDGKVYEITQR